MTSFRFVPVKPDRILDWKTLGPAAALHDFLVDHQTDAEGNVYYGKAFGYAWVRSKWPEAEGKSKPTIRTLERYMRRLKSLGYVHVKVLPFGGGMRVRLVNSAKWAPAARQLTLFSEPLSISSGKALEKQLKSQPPMATDVSLNGRQMCRLNEVKK